MNLKRHLITKIINLIFLYLLCSPLNASDVRIQSLGYTSLITEDEDNAINLYDFGVNSAWLFKDEHREWLEFNGVINGVWGQFQRQYDPEKSLELSSGVQGIKITGPGQIFSGFVEYHGNYHYNVAQVVNKEPYLANPYRLADNTIGDIKYHGPAIAAEYCQNLYKMKLFIAGKMAYQIETGLKYGAIQPRSMLRNFTSGLAVAAQVLNYLSIGATFDYSNSEEFIEYVPPPGYKYVAVEIKQFKGDTIATPGDLNMNWTSKLNTYLVGLQGTAQLAQNNVVGIKLSLNYEDAGVTTDNKSPREQGTWKLKGYKVNFISRNRLGRSPWNIGFSFDRIHHNDWAQHPYFDLLYGDDYFTGNYSGCGITYHPINPSILIAGEIHYHFHKIEKNDFVSNLIESGKVFNRIYKVGLEYSFRKSYVVRCGANYFNKTIGPQLLNFSEFERSYNKLLLTQGMGIKHKNLEFDFHVEFSHKTRHDSSNPGTRNAVAMIISLKILAGS